MRSISGKRKSTSKSFDIEYASRKRLSERGAGSRCQEFDSKKLLHRHESRLVKLEDLVEKAFATRRTA